MLADARGEAGFAATVLRWYAGRGEELLADRVTDDERGRLVTRHRPFGVIAAITPWNAPLILSALKVAPALVAGNAIVVKPSPLAPFGVTRMLETVAAVAARRAWSGSCTARSRRRPRWSSHELVSRVAFTGGDVAGRAIASLAGRGADPERARARRQRPGHPAARRRAGRRRDASGW